jgi:hypothetical protein
LPTLFGQEQTVGGATGGTFIANVRSFAGDTGSVNILHYDTSNNEVVYNTNKTFVINHPLEGDTKLLVHACLEGPEAAVFYRGYGEIPKDRRRCTIQLPPYVSALASDFTVHITPILDDLGGEPVVMGATEVVDNCFDVIGNGSGRFCWIVHGRRHAIAVEVPKDDVTVHGAGPYTWLQPKGH